MEILSMYLKSRKTKRILAVLVGIIVCGIVLTMRYTIL